MTLICDEQADRMRQDRTGTGWCAGAGCVCWEQGRMRMFGDLLVEGERSNQADFQWAKGLGRQWG